MAIGSVCVGAVVGMDRARIGFTSSGARSPIRGNGTSKEVQPFPGAWLDELAGPVVDESEQAVDLLHFCELGRVGSDERRWSSPNLHGAPWRTSTCGVQADAIAKTREMVGMSPLSHVKYMLLAGASLVVIALFFGVPLQSALFFGILLACPLMMIFMRGGHGAGHEHGQNDGKDTKNQQSGEHSTQPHRM